MKEIRENTLYVDGVSALDLVEDYGTPLYVLSKTAIEERIGELRTSFLDKYPKTRVAYAAKAFMCKAMVQIIEEEGLGLDVVSGGELYTAMAMDFPPERIEFNGNNKSYEELAMAIDYGVGRIIIDGMGELDKIEALCQEKNKKAQVLYRISPGISNIKTHKYMSTGMADSKFGIPLEEGILQGALERAIQSDHVDFYGFHFHVGSQLLDNQSHLEGLGVILDLVEEVYKKFGHRIREINLGGGFGVHYTHQDRPPFAYFLDPLMAMIGKRYDIMGLERPQVVIEPGRSLVAEAGLTLYRVGDIKKIPGIRTYVSVDGGMTDNIRPALYQAEYTGLLANRAQEEEEAPFTIAGKCCESGDILIKDLALPTPKEGDLLAVLSTGAYGYSMASNYNRLPTAPVVLVSRGKSQVMVQGQTYEDLIRNDREVQLK
ncbi:MAG: diaminopimelate decarboxylase [Tissierellia bacterium]|nr:diaminopimelate decarboxylase [Tissierellia bacterium]